MIKGMTGFGCSQVSSGGISAVIEIKSVNHRYFDANYYLPNGFSSVENKIQNIIQKNITRGRVTVSVKMTQKPGQNIFLNKENVNKYKKLTTTLKKEFGFKDQLTLSDLVKLPGVFEVKDTSVTPEEIWTSLEKGIRKALKSLVYMRNREGKSLSVDILDKLKRMALQIGKIKKRAQIVLKEKKKKFSPEEFSSFQKSCDINEELSRALHYIDEIKLLLKSNVSIGKKIDFIAQEMQRETNTIGSKLQDKVVSNSVIAMKSKIEKIREQSQNIE